MRETNRGSQKFVECATCPVRGLRCDDCMLTGIDAFPNPFAVDGLPLDANEARAVDLLRRAGLVSDAVAAGACAQRERLQLYSATG